MIYIINSAKSITAIIIAAGKSSRYGENKLLLPINGISLFEHCVQKVLNIDFNEVIIVIGDENISRICSNLATTKAFKVVNNFNNNGIGTSIKKALLNSNEDNNYMFFVCDQPFLTISTINNLINNFDNYKLIRPIYNETLGNPVIFPNFFRDKLLRVEDSKGGMSVVAKDTEITTVLAVNEYEFMDIDTVKDYELVQKILKEKNNFI